MPSLKPARRKMKPYPSTFADYQPLAGGQVGCFTQLTIKRRPWLARIFARHAALKAELERLS